MQCWSFADPVQYSSSLIYSLPQQKTRKTLKTLKHLMPTSALPKVGPTRPPPQPKPSTACPARSAPSSTTPRPAPRAAAPPGSAAARRGAGARRSRAHGRRRRTRSRRRPRKAATPRRQPPHLTKRMPQIAWHQNHYGKGCDSSANLDVFLSGSFQVLSIQNGLDRGSKQKLLSGLSYLLKHAKLMRSNQGRRDSNRVQ